MISLCHLKFNFIYKHEICFAAIFGQELDGISFGLKVLNCLSYQLKRAGHVTCCVAKFWQLKNGSKTLCSIHLAVLANFVQPFSKNRAHFARTYKFILFENHAGFPVYSHPGEAFFDANYLLGN